MTLRYWSNGIIYDGQVLRGKQNADGSRSKTWEERPNANAADYVPPTLSEAEGRTIEQRNLAQIRGLKINNSSIDNSSEDAIIESKEKRAIKNAFIHGKTSDEIVGVIIDNHKGLADFTPAEMKDFLDANGYNTKPLGGKSSLKGIPFNEGGRYRTDFMGDGYFMYHPAKNSHHNGAYWRASSGRKGDNRYDMEGNPIK